MLDRARHQPARAALARRCRQLGLRLFGRFLCGCHRGALVAALPDVQLCHAGAAGDRRRRSCRSRPNATGIFGHSMGGHGALVWRCAIRTATNRFRVRARSPRRCNVRGARRHLPTIWAPIRRVGASYDATELVARKPFPASHPHRSRHGRSISRRATQAGEIFGCSGDVRATLEPAHAAWLRSRLLFHPDFHGGPSAPPRNAPEELKLTAPGYRVLSWG